MIIWQSAHNIHASVLSGALSKSFECPRKNRVAGAIQPAESPLADPLPLDWYEASAAGWTPGNLNLKPGETRLDPVFERLAVALVDEYLLNPVIAQAVHDQQVRLLTASIVGRMNNHAPA